MQSIHKQYDRIVITRMRAIRQHRQTRPTNNDAIEYAEHQTEKKIQVIKFFACLKNFKLAAQSYRYG